MAQRTNSFWSKSPRGRAVSVVGYSASWCVLFWAFKLIFDGATWDEALHGTLFGMGLGCLMAVAVWAGSAWMDRRRARREAAPTGRAAKD